MVAIDLEIIELSVALVTDSEQIVVELWKSALRLGAILTDSSEAPLAVLLIDYLQVRVAKEARVGFYVSSFGTVTIEILW